MITIIGYEVIRYEVRMVDGGIPKKVEFRTEEDMLKYVNDNADRSLVVCKITAPIFREE